MLATAPKPATGCQRRGRRAARRPRRRTRSRRYGASTPDRSNVDISRCSAPACSISGNAIAAPLPSPRRRRRSAAARARARTSTRPWSGSAERCPANSHSRQLGSHPHGDQRGRARGDIRRGAPARRARGPRGSLPPAPRARARRRPARTASASRRISSGLAPGGGAQRRATTSRLRSSPAASRPVPRPTARSGSTPGERARERGRGRRVADADLAEHEAVGAALGERAAASLRADRERLRALLCRSSPGRSSCRPLPRARPWRRRTPAGVGPAQADVGDHSARRGRGRARRSPSRRGRRPPRPGAETAASNRLVPRSAWPWSAAKIRCPARSGAGGGAPVTAAQRSTTSSSAPRLPPA